MRKMFLAASAAIAVSVALPAAAQAPAAAPYDAAVFAKAKALQPKVVAWRRDIHQNPELGNREVRTSKLVADHLRKLGYEVKTGVAKTGVVAVLKGGRPGGVVALRADMDALPVAEKTGLPFASKATAQYNGQTVPVMHACGHDAHVAILMGAAEVLASMKAEIPGTVVLIFQPAEEGAPAGEEGGAKVMVEEGVLQNPKVDAVFGLHVVPGPVGALFWRPGPMMAASDRYEIALKGKQTHGAQPWSGIDMASVAADIVTAFNQIAARQVNVAKSPTVLTVGTIHGGLRYNIIPEDLEMAGTLRTFDPDMRKDVMGRIEKTVTSIAERYGASAKLTWGTPNPVTNNHRELTAKMKPTLQRAAEGGNIKDDIDYITGAEDFSYYQLKVPGLFYDLGVGNPPGVNHSPFFTVDERALEVGVRAQALTALDYLRSVAPAP
ncbi:amidohydrolase [Phenylobacterium sp.]|uniref:amidohydrolase n=1 Tax=Phenylobacterium sp. TaxID=1871053 RepID=UPI002BC565A9|nr:amidohydrolase [Phenylobacterium sp.]HVI30984.1 amidohydrolase [Phenylobacterium sp.]